MTIGFLFLIVAFLLAASFYTYLQDRRLQSVSISALRMASWNLAQLGNEAGALDRELHLTAAGVGNPDDLALRYDILWSRYDYLLTNAESRATRDHDDNQARLEELFSQLRQLEQPLAAQLATPGDWKSVLTDWNEQKTGIQRLVIDNFVGNEANRLVTAVEASRERLSNLRILTLGALVAVFLYMALAVSFVRKQARVDPVTGLPNALRLHSIRGVDRQTSIITCEIREFQLVISDYGTEGAHRLLRHFTRQLRKQLLSEDELIHASQSEFVLLIAHRKSETVSSIIEGLVDASNFDWRIGNSVLHISATFGVDPECDDGSLTWDARHQRAHRALTQARLENRTFYINGEDLRRRLQEEQKIHAGLLRFLNNEPSSLGLHLVYQPIVSASNRNYITGAEVLLRCKEATLGFVPPNRVVDLCERFGLGVELGRWLFRQVALETGQLYEGMDFGGSISLNLNPAMLNSNLVNDIQALLIDAGVPGNALCMEITEDNAALEFKVINTLISRLRELGVAFALDDFGTGHSSLEYVRELKVDRLKIDRCFVDGIELSNDKARFLGSIIAMAEQAYMKSVIEGVENEAQWQLVEKLGGTLIQGYHAHRPMALNCYINLLLDANSSYPTQAMNEQKRYGN
ncbi:bifunctional diguanylate cyclase/phosphodiesterase [Marinobacter sp. M-5]|uniref:bifunctional diguanylate cyclase/phosphodiesterase n=1 Tax=Marinobacter sp. M-5 TaxID=3081089 RepID=UPI00293CCF21|nr:bifunctional diguanylate cyclase/phosphodiesterase [Marinobacter sp. M-5]MDV3504209.1 bifunctional diguanylate cyclase/phosphodiesterase [Marinobacter sp. M-5]